MKVIFVVADYSLAGGGERVATNVAGALWQLYRFDTQILSISLLGCSLPFELPEEVEVASLGVKLSNPRFIVRAWKKVASLMQMRKRLTEENPDVVVGIGLYPSVLLAFTKKQQFRRIGSDHAAFNAPNVAWKILRKIAYPRLDAVLFLTERAKKKGEKLNRETRVIPNFSGFQAQTRANPASKKLIAVGRLDRNKGFLDLIEIFATVIKKRPGWSLTILGEGDEYESLSLAVQRSGLSECVSITPHVRDIEREYLRCSICVMTSRSEGFPMALLEAQSLGLAAIAYDCDEGPAEIIADDVTGYLVRPGDKVLFARKLGALMDTPDLRAAFSTDASRRAESFSKTKICAAWRQLFAEIRS